MKTPIRILGIAGSLRRGSYNRAALRAATEIAPKGATVETFELNGIPSFNQDEEQNPPAKVAELKRRIREADAILFVTPEYNWSVSGVLKNAIDWASRPHGDSAWNGKPAAIMRASTGAIGTARAQNHLRQILVYLNMFPINQPEVLISHAMDRFDRNCENQVRAAQIVEYGPPSVIQVANIPRPQPHSGQLLVRVKAAGVGRLWARTCPASL